MKVACMIFGIIMEIATNGDERCFQGNVWLLGWLFQIWDLWDLIVGVRFLFCMGKTFQGWCLILLKEMNIIVCVNT